jgi:uncharacterized protein (TIGR02300 family)
MGGARIRPIVEDRSVVKPELGTKRTCPNCAARFYDLLRNPIECPKCEFKFVAETLLPSRASHQTAAPARPAAVVEKRFEPAEVESMEETEVASEEEVAAIEDVDLDEEAPAIGGEEEDTFLEESEDNQDVSGIVGGGDNEEER